MAEAVDWKRRHLDALGEMETSERRWRGVEQILRRLVSRLCAVAMGHDARLDAPLQTLSAAARSDADETQLRALYDSLTAAALAVEKSAPAQALSQTLPAPARVLAAVDPAQAGVSGVAGVQPAAPSAVRAAVTMLI